MQYKSELVSKGVVLETGIYTRFNSPKQVARTVIDSNRSLNIDKFLIYVLNENGDYWVYIVKKEDGKYKVRPSKPYDIVLSFDEIEMIMSDNTTLRGVLHG